jgi:tetratricopeptide (TPR) repeat protein
MRCVVAVRLSATLLSLVACRTTPPGPAPASAPVSPPEPSPATAVPLHAEALGTYSWRIATRQPLAQAYFDQGLRLMYAYAQDDAQRSFEQSRRADPGCAMCWWGEAWSLGSYFNGPMQPAHAPRAYAAVQQARALGATAAPVERALIDALATRYAPVHPAGGRRGLDSAFATAMAGVHARFPAHDDVATIHADALMLLEPRRGVWPLTKPSIPRIHGILEEVLRRDLRHPGACHAYIHATETTPKVGDAQPCADLLSATIPAVSHINHMPSHTYNRVGRWGDATRANLAAVETDRRAARGGAYAVYPTHNLHMLLFSAALDGQEQVSVQAARDYTALAGRDGYGFQALVLTRFGRFDDVLTLRTRPTHPISLGLWSFGRGLAHLRVGGAAGLDSARASLAHVDSLASHTPPTQALRQHEPARLLGIVGAILRGEVSRATGDLDAAVAAFRTALTLEQGLTYDEPEPLPFLSHEFLGAALLESGRARDAVDVYEAALAARPNSGWSLFGLEAALRASGRAVEADAARERLTTAWQRSATVLRASRF